jgi:hypothetical protein
MIFIAIIAIVIAGTFHSLIAYRWIAKESIHTEAQRQMFTWKQLLTDEPVDSLSPCIVAVSADGRAKLPRREIVENSVTLYDPATGALLSNATGIKADSGSGEITVTDRKLFGKKAAAVFSFQLPFTGEVTTVSSAEPCKVSLYNSPIQKVEKVELVDGTKLTELPPYKYKAEIGGNSITFDRSLAGKPVRITYYGGLIKNICTGEYLDAGLNVTTKPTGLKIVRIKESYNTGNDIETGLMRVK